jgi:vacuolar iron transporter family protein
MTTVRPHEPTHQHRDVSGGWLRPTVFGAMDGLVTNVSLIAGVGGGGLDRQRIILAGLAGLVAGAFSMATGEYTSVQSQNELVGAEVELERRELDRNPQREQRELAEAFVDKGVDPELARGVAAGSSFLSFSIGAIVPLIPFLAGVGVLWPALLVAAVTLFVAGAVVARLTQKPIWFGGLRQLALATLAAGVTYAVGRGIGASVG